MLLPPPAFFLNDCLGFNMDRAARLDIAEANSVGEPAVRGWFRTNKVPDGTLERFREFLIQKSDGRLEELLKGLPRDVPRGRTVAFQWQAFCQGMLSHPDIGLPCTLGAILEYAEEWLNIGVSDSPLTMEVWLEQFKPFLQDQLAPRFNLPPEHRQKIQSARTWQELSPSLNWLQVEVFIYFMAMAEAEVLWHGYGLQASWLEQMALPRLCKGKVVGPVKQFFRFFFDRLVEKGFYPNLKAVAASMPRIMALEKTGPDDSRKRHLITQNSGIREIKRARSQGIAPSFETFRTWVNRLIPRHIYPSKESREDEAQLLVDAFGATLVLETFFQKAKETYAAKEVIARFASYCPWFDFHLAALPSVAEEGPGSPQAPCKVHPS